MFPGPRQGVVDGPYCNLRVSGPVRRTGRFHGLLRFVWIRRPILRFPLGQVHRPGGLFLFRRVHVEVYWFRGYGDLSRLPIHFNHPIIQASISVPHYIVKDDQLLEFFPEGLFEAFCPHEIIRSGNGARSGRSLFITTIVTRASGQRPTIVPPPLPLIAMRLTGPVTRKVLVRPRVLAQENIGIFEALEEDLKAAGFCGQRLPVPGVIVAVPKGIVKGPRGQPDNIRIWHHVRPQLAIQGVGCRFAHVRKVRDKTSQIVSNETHTQSVMVMDGYGQRTRLCRNSRERGSCGSTCSISGCQPHTAPRLWA